MGIESPFAERIEQMKERVPDQDRTTTSVEIAEYEHVGHNGQGKAPQPMRTAP